MQIEGVDNFITSLGVEAYRVGGSVRDQLLGRRAKDADYMVRGVPLDELGRLLRESTFAVTVKDLRLRDGQHVGYRVGRPFDTEIVLPRKEVSTGPGHGDFQIIVDPDLTLDDDARRRDFTFNALYLPVPAGLAGIVDPTGRGLHDLQRRIIHTTHEDSFRDDPLRILRALRFVARGFTLSAATGDQMRKHATAIDGLTANGHTSGTVYDEMSKILGAPGAVAALRIARDAGVLGQLFPELVPMIGFEQNSRYHDLTTDEHTFRALSAAVDSAAPLRVRWALLFHDAGKPASAWVGRDGRTHYYAQDGSKRAASALRGKQGPTEDHEIVSAQLWRRAALRMSGVESSLVRDVETLIRNHMLSYRKRGVGERVRRMRVALGHDLTHDLILHRACDIVGKQGGVDAKHLTQLREMVDYLNDANDRRIPASVADLRVNGEDALAAGAAGREIGEALRQVLDEVVVRGDEAALTREWQLSRLIARLS